MHYHPSWRLHFLQFFTVVGNWLVQTLNLVFGNLLFLSLLLFKLNILRKNTSLTIFSGSLTQAQIMKKRYSQIMARNTSSNQYGFPGNWYFSFNKPFFWIFAKYFMHLWYLFASVIIIARNHFFFLSHYDKDYHTFKGRYASINYHTFHNCNFMAITFSER